MEEELSMTAANHRPNTLPVRQALWNLQKELLIALKQEFDQENGYEASPVEWFQMITTADRYSWLRDLTSLMADVDAMTELEVITDKHAAVARHEIERLLFNQDATKTNFAESYSNILMAGMTLLPLHSHLRSALQALPKQELTDEQSAVARKHWHEEQREHARKKRN
jgi:hypothetical protein